MRTTKTAHACTRRERRMHARDARDGRNGGIERLVKIPNWRKNAHPEENRSTRKTSGKPQP
jgi:hypothetical protein